jgi:integrase
MASIQKRGDSYRIKVSCGYDTHGKQVVQTMTWKPENKLTERQVAKELQRQVVNFENSCLKGNVTANIKFEDFAKRWFKEHAEPNLKGNTIYKYHSFAPRIYKEIGHLRIDKITPRHLQIMVENLSNSKSERTGEKWSGATIQRYMNVVSAVFQYAVKQQLLTENPCHKIQLPNRKAKESKCFSLSEAQKFLNLLSKEMSENSANCRDFQMLVFFTIAIYTGMRKGEILALEWGNIDLQTGVIMVNKNQCYTPERGIYIDTPKTKKSNRSLKVPIEVVDLMKRFREWQAKYSTSLGNKWNDSDRLFFRSDGLPLINSYPNEFMRNFCQSHDLPEVTVHGCRHTSASLLINSGVDVKTVQATLGHSSASVTLNIYAHSFEAAQVRASEAISKSLNLGGYNQSSQEVTMALK